MIQENLNEELDPKDIDAEDNTANEEQEEQDDDEGYDILPSNGPGLAGDDGEQIIDEDDENVGEEEIDEED